MALVLANAWTVVFGPHIAGLSAEMASDQPVRILPGEPSKSARPMRLTQKTKVPNCQSVTTGFGASWTLDPELDALEELSLCPADWKLN
ncbi:hypothetical protein SCARD494_02501 [Seiridium cardinale]